ncbi:AAA family ATPase [Clavibacter michiganensis subsp. insidiosus]|uniref:AAA family ATPase n=1 Tax=Clavibacter michiganensis subsp. insidiosus TaxID=33014 RepID=A0A399SRV1_9MICO|nr:ATP-binding protein [Clavibacter michiganensis]AWG01783.1 ATPase AAA [Clavibacter michiganensis subsp. insidiosus]OQJ59706.1 AAA family ATPase [Clavibacter michiganensis subsp. insidiosus]RII87872.1 AAA family ATPase [Clavibacter michiganensis subsp. insidiosus]RIJ44605.1 AAA family ATPase [Clavibacter michiganensis subsp. insidiosus]RMC85029.1 AAA family ATPase [Clavibacter michiganensis subsp. insidiosus]
MDERRTLDHQLRTLRFWLLLELLNPQAVPPVTARSDASEARVSAWRPGDPLPWETLPTPPPRYGAKRVWRHTVYLGAYPLEATFARLHALFPEDRDAYQERRGGTTAAAGLLVDDGGRYVPDSAILSSASWAVGHLSSSSTTSREWIDDFGRAAEAWAEAVDEHEGARADARDAGLEPLDGDALSGLLRLAHASAGLVGDTELATDVIRIQSVPMSLRTAEGAPEIDFLNSFHLEDLTSVSEQVARSDVGAALSAYLTGDGDVAEDRRIDVVADIDAMEAGAGIARLPKGRWPTKPSHPLATSQQFAVDHALHDLTPTAGLMGVNGPPGTGKTTMLRDILAGNITERARRLSALARPEDAFTSVVHQWNGAQGHRMSVPQLRPELTGFEMVVASSNNSAVENISSQIPGRDAIDERWQASADYFGELASLVMRRAGASPSSSDGDEAGAWGLVAARLGRKENRSTFFSSFWFGEQSDGRAADRRAPVRGMQELLTRWKDGSEPFRPWADARRAFQDAERRVDELIRERSEADARRRRLPHLREEEHEIAGTVVRLETWATQVDAEAAAHAVARADAAAELERAAGRIQDHVLVKPGLWETLFTLGRAIRDWRLALRPLEVARDQAAALDDVERRRSEADRLAQARAAQEVGAARQELSAVRRRVAVTTRECEQDDARLTGPRPGAGRTDQEREMVAPWLDATLDAARSDLFLAALDLHRDFLANAAATMLRGLRAACQVVAGSSPADLEGEKLKAAWQLFFLVVPAISTTFASSGRMFGSLGREALGWLLIDEAGQAAPQHAVASIWRARRVVAVGDPLQLPPIISVPQKTIGALALAHGVTPTWIPPRASVQTLADRVARFGTSLPQGDETVWVSAPLRVHRRCDDPMFTICNRMAYAGLMFHAVPDRSDATPPDRFDGPDGPRITPSHWADEPATTPGSHLQPGQLERTRSAIDYLLGLGVGAEEIIAISPFRSVVDRLDSLKHDYPGLTAGTIHTAQGREAEVVLLVLGGDPDKPGARAWAAENVNLLNVAVSRARRRLYVVGDLASWRQHPYCSQVAAAIPARRRGGGAD